MDLMPLYGAKAGTFDLESVLLSVEQIEHVPMPVVPSESALDATNVLRIKLNLYILK